MTAGPALETKSPTETGERPGLRDARILEGAIRKSVRTSPEAFLKTVGDVDELPFDHWEREIHSSTWAVIERGQEVVGIAAARLPDREIDKDIDPDTSRFIESVWIDPEFRGHQMGERLVRFLFEMECEKNQDIKQFLLWVLDKNQRAIRLYERMGFLGTHLWNQGTRGDRTELEYQLAFDLVMIGTPEKAVNEAARRADLHQFGVTYRILGRNSE
jgi:ribosomal protein S18 acetylase RimI-like enzyme